MQKKRAVFFSLAVLGFFGCQSIHGGRSFSSDSTEIKAGLGGWLSASDNAQLWNQYCIGPANDPSVVPQPNYENEFIKNRVIPKLQQVSESSYYLYGDVVEVYGLRDPQTKKMVTPNYPIPEGLNLKANAFMVYLCGEFRDRATLVEEKLKWISKIYKLPVTPQKQDIDVTISPFAQLSAHKYESFLELSSSIFYARKSTTNSKLQDLGSGKKIDSATEGFKVCDVKYMMSEYIAKNKNFDNLSSYESGLKNWSQAHCAQADNDYYYDFRGDSNFKPNSPESNAMIWASTTMAKMCSNPVTAKPGTNVTDQDCRDYFTKPFESRWNKARQGLMTWMFYPDQHQDVFGNSHSLLVIYPNIPSPHGQYGPLNYYFGFDQKSLTSSFNSTWTQMVKEDPSILNTGDMGFNALFNLNNQPGNGYQAFKRIQQAVDRHTDWYASGYDDLRGKKMDNSYSPFVASSYEISKSDAFIACGYTVPCGDKADSRKQWMFVFRVHKDNWYRTQDVAAGKPVDFSKMWFDETSFGQTGLADAENAFDRLGTALEGEYDSIMYVHNINYNVNHDGLPQDDPYMVAKLEGASEPAPLIPAPKLEAKVLVSSDVPEAPLMVNKISFKAKKPFKMTLMKDKGLKSGIQTIFDNYLTPNLPSGVKATFEITNATLSHFNMDVTFSPGIEKEDLDEVLKASTLKISNMKTVN